MRSQTRAMFLLTVAFLITSCPTGVVGMITSSNVNEAYVFCMFFWYLNSLLNTIIYSSKLPAVRNSLLNVLRRRNPESV